MTEMILYAFEDLTDDLPRPPMVAVRALLQAGLLPSPRGWAALPVETRTAIARHGLQGLVDVAGVRALAEQVPPRHIKLVSRSRDPDPDHVPPELTRALGPTRGISDGEWRALRAVDRSVLWSLTSNTRLLARAYDELAVAIGRPKNSRQTLWSGAIAHCELHVKAAALDRLVSDELLDGRAFVLARVAGIRSARRVSETFDLHAESGTGPVELDWTIYRDKESVLWQAHVSTWDGAFFPAAALLAATTAATALFDMIKDDDPAAHLMTADIREEAWRVGDEGTRDEEATTVYSAGRLGLARDSEARARQIQDLLDAAASRGVRGARRSADDDPAAPPDGRTVRDLAPPVGALVTSAVAPTRDSAPRQPSISAIMPPRVEPQGPLPGSMPLVDAAPHSGPISGPVPVSVGPVPSSHRDGAPRSPRVAQRTPRGLIVLFVASLFVLALALSIFGYVLAIAT
jgi:molybdenum cofactor biosynthesis enzyme